MLPSTKRRTDKQMSEFVRFSLCNQNCLVLHGCVLRFVLDFDILCELLSAESPQYYSYWHTVLILKFCTLCILFRSWYKQRIVFTDWDNRIQCWSTTL